MAYSNIYPTAYQPYYFQNGNQNFQNANQNFQNGNQNSIIWVQGEAGAKSYLVAPNATVQLWDSEAQVIYLKSADASGMPSMRILDYTIRDGQACINANQTCVYATKDEVSAIKNELDALQSKIGGLFDD